MLNWQGALLLLRSVKAKEKAGVNNLIQVCSESEMLVLRVVGARGGICPFEPSQLKPALYDPDALGKSYKMVRVRARRLPDDDSPLLFLIRPRPKYLNIHLVPFSSPSYLSRHSICWSCLKF